MKSIISICTSFILVCTILCEKIQAQDIKPFKAQEIKPYKAEEVKPTNSKASGTNNNNNESKATERKGDLNFFFGLYNYWVPGTSYTVPDYTNQREVVRVSAGTGVLPGSLRINTDGSYIWNSSWDGKIIKGKWRTTGDSSYPIELLNAQEGKAWKVGKSNEEGVAIHIWDGSTWYNGKKINGSK